MHYLTDTAVSSFIVRKREFDFFFVQVLFSYVNTLMMAMMREPNAAVPV